jgi:hypothetical protein
MSNTAHSHSFFKSSTRARGSWDQQSFGVIRLLSLLLLGLLSVLPLLIEHVPVDYVPPYRSAGVGLCIKAILLAGLAFLVGWSAWINKFNDSWLAALLPVFLAGLITGAHWIIVDQNAERAAWQRELYLDILNHRPEPSGELRVPHQYRPLPYGFVRVLERLTGDFWFSCILYRWFFSYWFLWGCLRFARLFLLPVPALLTLAPIAALYPLSIAHYLGQLTDPLSHALFVLALIYIVEDRWIALAAALALGVLAKETAVLLVPAYLACTWRQGLSALAKTAALGAACVAAFLAARLPLGWSLGYGSINGTEGLMIGDNLGIGEPRYQSAAPLLFNYLHPLLFIASFLPFMAWHWQRIDIRLRALFLVLTPLLLLSNLCFGWMYESRNYLPLLPLLGTMALQGWPARANVEPVRESPA